MFVRILFAVLFATQVAACSVTPAPPTIEWAVDTTAPGADASDTSGEGVGDAGN